jgi:hypothetical protein
MLSARALGAYLFSLGVPVLRRGKEGADSMHSTHPELMLEDGPPPGEGRERDDAIRAIVMRLSRPHASGGVVIERAAILAEGARSAAIVAWVIAHDGEPEATAPPASARGLHGARLTGGRGATGDTPRRYVLPVGALT